MEFVLLCENCESVNGILEIVANGHWSDIARFETLSTLGLKSTRHFGEAFSSWVYDQLSLTQNKCGSANSSSNCSRTTSISNMALILSSLINHQLISISTSLSLLNKIISYKVKADLNAILIENNRMDILLYCDEDVCYFVAQLIENIFEFIKSFGSRILSIMVKCNTIIHHNDNKIIGKLIMYINEASGGNSLLLSDWDSSPEKARNRLVDGSIDEDTSNLTSLRVKAEPFYDKDDEVMQYFISHSNFFRVYKEEYDNKLEYKTQVSVPLFIYLLCLPLLLCLYLSYEIV